jgi:hypothetical protein
VKDRHVGPVRLDWREQTVDARRLAGGVELRPAQESGDAVPPDVVVGDHDGHRSPAVTDQRFPNADAYQMLAYRTALGLDRGYLVYAKDAGEADRNHVGRNVTVIHVRAIDVEQPPTRLLAQVQDLAREIAGTSPAAASTAA